MCVIYKHSQFELLECNALRKKKLKDEQIYKLIITSLLFQTRFEFIYFCFKFHTIAIVTTSFIRFRCVIKISCVENVIRTILIKMSRISQKTYKKILSIQFILFYFHSIQRLSTHFS